MIRRNPNEERLAAFIKKDRIDDFSKLFCETNFQVDHKFSRLILFSEPFLRFSPPLLSVAAFYKAINIFRYLVANGADLNAKDDQQTPVVNFAVYGGDFQILQLIDENSISFAGTLFIAAERGFDAIFKWIYFYKNENLHARRNDGTTILHAASKSNNLPLIKFILEAVQDDLDIKDVFQLLQDLRDNKFNEYYEYDESESENENDSDNDSESESDSFY
ncbi:ankyrin repeat protein [Tritrichomonas foetus]|uniref:Ankyrin repeat protein n=1 Tax=Tritrichomonas foetus TaxID=1144522 RepID=A0A1J4JMC5_9EUKA|nr:ankyrin repeat protein [Tritrichomonas foetus]|eukprot:OHS99849.1 ankyrin repeat protein [Tritrichomonas foetus]